jgi:prolyl oligopeptidase
MKSIFFIFLTLLTATPFNSYAQEDDPYLWLEAVESDSSMDWVLKQNELTKTKLTATESFGALKTEFLTAYSDKDKIAYPSVVNGMVYNTWKDDDHVRGIWRRMPQADYNAGKDNWEIVLDLDALSAAEGKAWVFHGSNMLEPDMKRCLVTLSDGGTDEAEIREFDLENKTFIKEGFFLASSKGSANWLSKDELIISRDFGEGSLTTSGYPRIVKRWKRGTPIEDAEQIFDAPATHMGCWGYSRFRNGKYSAGISVYENFYSHQTYEEYEGEMVKLGIPDDSDANGLYKGQMLISLHSDWEINGEKFLIGSVVSVGFEDLMNNKVEPKLVAAQKERSNIGGVAVCKDFVLLNMTENVQSKLLKVDLVDGKWIGKDIDAPEFGSISLVDYDKDEKGFYYIFSNFITPASLYYSDSTDAIVIKRQKDYFDVTGLEVKYEETKSKDGTLIPYFIVHKKDIKLDGTNPTLVYAYGGFNISQRPSYKKEAGIGWLEEGGVYVVACIRGGGEFGPAWHKAALKEKRQNAYDDFYSVCENLIDEKITSPDHMGAFGWSNGGLMAGVVATQRPDLFNAVIIGAPLLDMKRFSHMLAGASWMGEYGDPDTDDWEYIKKYSPYHNIHPDTKYPEVLFMTSTKDDRVHPAHARKMAARMMEQGHPILYYETVEGGHSASSTNDQAAFNSALMYSYLWSKLK